MFLKKSRLNLLNRFDQIQHALWHIVHGIFPTLKFFEKRVSTPDFDHIRDTKKFKSRGYLPHLVMNLKATVRHLVEAIFSFLEVKIK